MKKINLILIALLINLVAIRFTVSADDKTHDEIDVDAFTASINGLVTISPTNKGDCYLISQFIVIIAAILSCQADTPLNIYAPLGYSANQLMVQNWNSHDKHNKVIMVWNRNNGQFVAAIPKTELNLIVLALENCFTEQKISSLEIIYNEILGINGLSISNSCYEVISLIGNLLANLIGIGCEPKALFNLLGLLVLKSDLPTTICYISPHQSPVGELVLVDNSIDLQIAICKESVIIAGFSYWDRMYIFQDSLYPAQTQLGTTVGHLIGYKDLLALIEWAVDEITAKLNEEEATELLEQLLAAISIDGSPETYLSIVYCKTCFEN